MKKLLVLMMALVMALSFTACGVNKDEVEDTFNSTNDELTALVNLANDNLEKLNQETADAMNQILSEMEAYKAEIESDELTQERADEIVAELKSYPSKIAELKAKVDDLIENYVPVMNEEQAAVLVQIAQSLSDVYAKLAEHYDIYNDETKQFVDDIAVDVNDINSLLDGSVTIDSMQADELILSYQGLLEAVEAGWAEIEAQLAQ